jgi:hypothetical protein
VDRRDLAQGDAAHSPLGYRIVAPVGLLQAQLDIDGCVAPALKLSLPVTLEPDHLVLLQFDGQKLSLQSTQAWTPATLDAVRGDVAGLHEHAASTDGALGMLTKLAIASVLLNVIVVLGVMVVALKRRNAPADRP